MVELHTTIEGSNTLYFDKRIIRRVLRRESKAVSRLAQWYASGPAGSVPGEAPGFDTGALHDAIAAKVSRSGFAAAVAPFRTAALMRKGYYYPAFLAFGADRRPGPGGVLEARDSVVIAALAEREPKIIPALQKALYAALT